MNVFSHFRDEIAGMIGRLSAAGTLPAGLDTSRVTVEPPRDQPADDGIFHEARRCSHVASLRSCGA